MLIMPNTNTRASDLDIFLGLEAQKKPPWREECGVNAMQYINLFLLEAISSPIILLILSPNAGNILFHFIQNMLRYCICQGQHLMASPKPNHFIGSFESTRP